MDKFLKIIKLAVWDSAGRMWCPVWGYDGNISHYAPASEALDILHREYVS
jgi:hypothetical protein